MPDSLADIEHKVERLKEPYDEAWSTRQDNWLPLAQRLLLPDVPEHVKANAKNSPVLSPILEENISADVAIGTLNPSEVAVIDQEGSDDAKADAEDMRLFYEVWWNRWNHDGAIDKPTFTHFCWPDGVAVWRLDATKPDEYDGDEDGAQYISSRKKYFRNLNHETWRLEVKNPRTCYWWPLKENEFREFVEDVEIDIPELDTLQRREDGMSAVDVLELARRTPGEPTDYSSTSRTSAEKAHFVAYEYLDAKEGCWYRCEYVYPSGSTLQEKGELLDKIKLPHKSSSYFVVPSDSCNFAEQTDPHRRYRPKLYALGVMVGRLNEVNTLEQGVMWSQLTDHGVYMNIPAQGLNADSRAVMDAWFPGWSVMEGAGSEDHLVAHLPVRVENEMLLSPGVIRSFPGFVPVLQSISNIKTDIRNEIAQYQTNPYLTGRAFQEYREGTGTAAKLGTQNAGTVYGGHRGHIDAARARVHRAQANCILSWEEDNEGLPYEYPATSSGDSKESGKMVVVNARKAGRKNEINCFTRVEMQQERLIREQQSAEHLQRGWITFEEHLKNLGNDDPHRKAIELAEEGNLLKQQLDMEPTMQLRRAVLTQTITGLNFEALKQEAQRLLTPPQQGGPPGGGAPTAQPPPGPGMPRADQGLNGVPAVAPNTPVAGGV